MTGPEASMSSSRLLKKLAAVSVVGLAGCAGAASDGTHGEDSPAVIVAPEQQGVVRFDVLSAASVKGTFEYHGVTLAFDAEADAVKAVTVELRGMVLTGTFEPADGVFDLDGFNASDGSETQMTEVDRAVIHTFEVALTDIYRERGAELPALEVLNRAVTVWGDYSPTLTLHRTFYGRQERATLQNLCGQVNRGGQGTGFAPRYSWGSHDCLTIKNFWSDCAAVSAGCMYGDDSSTVERGFLSMHPGGSCNDNSYFGTSSTNMHCYEPDHDPNVEYAYGDCLGRCGGGCGGGTTFTQACLDHDICVRFGHIQVSAECDDEVLDAAFDAAFAPNCDGTSFTVNYNWSGSTYEANCPAAWNYTNDGCDVGCQFVDGDCFR
jgi:hypothetical protein